MNFSINQLSSLAKMISADPNNATALLKLSSIDVLKSLGDGKYSVLLENKTLTAQSDKPLSSGEKYWVQFTHAKDSTIVLSNLLKAPQLLQNTKNMPIEYSIKDLQTLLNTKDPTSTIKQNLLEHLSSASTKEDFSNISTLLLSLHNQTVTIPLLYHEYLSVLQFKKRYNKKTKKEYIDFYAALDHLGPVSGLLMLENGEINVKLGVAYETTKNFLENNMNNFSHTIQITLQEGIEPLYNTNASSSHSILDLSI